MNILRILLRLLFLYFLFRFLFKVIFSFIRFFWRHPNKYEKETVINKDHRKTGKKTFDYKDIVDAEFKEIE